MLVTRSCVQDIDTGRHANQLLPFEWIWRWQPFGNGGWTGHTFTFRNLAHSLDLFGRFSLFFAPIGLTFPFFELINHLFLHTRTASFPRRGRVDFATWRSRTDSIRGSWPSADFYVVFIIWTDKGDEGRRESAKNKIRSFLNRVF